MFIVFKKKTAICSAIIVSIILVAVLIDCLISASRSSVTKYASKSDNNYLIMIYIEEKKLYLFKDDKCIKDYYIASGKQESPSPIGEWKIIEKQDWGEGFGGYWLGLNVIWGIYGIHGTTSEGSIGYAASHGCIRMYNRDIKELYDIVPVGTPVVIRDGPFGPFGTGFRDLAPGDRGADVLAVQQKLKELGYFKGAETGIYEDDLKRAVYAFQKDKNLSIKYTLTYEDYTAMGFNDIE